MNTEQVKKIVKQIPVFQDETEAGALLDIGEWMMCYITSFSPIDGNPLILSRRPNGSLVYKQIDQEI